MTLDEISRAVSPESSALVDSKSAAESPQQNANDSTNSGLTEPTGQGLQYILAGCERDKTRGPKQMDLF